MESCTRPDQNQVSWLCEQHQMRLFRPSIGPTVLYICPPLKRAGLINRARAWPQLALLPDAGRPSRPIPTSQSVCRATPLHKQPPSTTSATHLRAGRALQSDWVGPRASSSACPREAHIKAGHHSLWSTPPASAPRCSWLEWQEQTGTHLPWCASGLREQALCVLEVSTFGQTVPQKAGEWSQGPRPSFPYW